VKILLSNKYYYPRGGDCIYTLELEKLLTAGKNEVAVFSMQFPSNLKNDYTKYFPSEVDYSKGSIINRIKQITRPLNSFEVRKKFNQFLLDYQPDIVHLNNIHSQLSPVLAELAHKRNIPVVWTLHDYKLLCPRYDCMRNGKPCELCFDKKKNVIKYNCMKGSKIASVLAYAEAVYWNQLKIEKYTNIFICPSKFLKNKMIQGGFNKDKLIHLSNFIDVKKTIHNDYNKKDYCCFVGRLSNEKGVKTLLEAAILANVKLKIIGTGPLEEELKKKYNKGDIEFCGHLNWEDIKEAVSSAKFLILPSECYENNPLSVIEALCLGTPVLGANIGGIPELIKVGVNGALFESGNIANLTDKINWMMSVSSPAFDYKAIAEEAREKFSSENYYNELLKIYKSVLNS